MKSPALLAFVSAITLQSSLVAAPTVDFARDIQPIFSRNCYECHGAEKQKGELRLDQRSSAIHSDKVGAIVPGKPKESELYRRITLAKGHEDIMPSRGEPLSKAETELVRQWIQEGAVWPDTVVTAKHWSYVAPSRPALPKIKDARQARNEIDHFVFSRLQKEKLKPSPEAHRPTLIRRVYLDLIGIPPSPSEVNAFVADKSPDAYDKVVDRLLASPQYGVRWARPWLDLARYADSNGYQRDNLWEMWAYRDWVINALNQDMPFDQFTIEQLAGDLLPDATTEQKIATGFNRCAATNIEAGSDQEETRVNQIFDRVNTLGSVWLGSTLECAQCHNHKYDPISQKEYYQFFAFFNNTTKETDFATPKATAALKITGPYLTVPDPALDEQRNKIKEQVDALNARIEAHTETFTKTQSEWEEKVKIQGADGSKIHSLDVATFETESGSQYQKLDDNSVLLVRDDNEATPETDTYTLTIQTNLSHITGFKLEALTDPSLPGNGPGRASEQVPNFVLNNFSVKVVSKGKSDSSPPIKLRNAQASFSQKNFTIAEAIDGRPRTGWAIRPEFGKDHWATFETEQPINLENGSKLIFKLEQNNGGGRLIGRVRLSALTGVTGSNAVPSDVVQIVQLPAGNRSAVQQKRLTEYRSSVDPKLTKLRAERTKLERELNKVKPPRTLVMEESSENRMSSVFVRGSFLERGEPVKPATPSALHSLPAGSSNRLALAQWLVDTNNPLVARVTLNRWWAEFFGYGLVRTPEDFGIKGDLPTHPELLDWLASEFMSPTVNDPGSVAPRAWSMKHIHRLIVTSATYRQSSAVTPQLLEKDDQNKLYARGPRFRMDAEMIRDNALAVSGLLSLKQGGPPIRPYQPAGIWESKVGGDAITYEISEGEDRYRRGIYIVWKRTSPYPSFINFDATERNACVVKRSRSNTPLQALTLLNDPVYVEAAAALAKRVLDEQPSANVDERIRHAFRLCLSRSPQPGELAVLQRLYTEQLSASKKDPEAARKLLAEFNLSRETDIADFAAWHAVTWALLNLNETITKG